jgi:putative oxidoreductase
VTNWVLLLGRLIVAACVLPPAIKRLSNVSGFSFQLALAEMPYPTVVATAVVVAEIFGPIALVLGLAPRAAAGVLVAATVVTTGTLHRFWEVGGALARQAEQAIFIGNASLVAGLLFYAVSGPGAWSWQALWRRPEPPKPVKKQPRPRAAKPRPAPEPEELADAA